MEMESEITKFYKSKFVLLTGATGFVGKAILEKLLRSCPNILNIYVLVRPKSGSDVESRLRVLLKDPVFNAIREKGFEEFSKVIAVRGDIAHPNLGMDKEDYTTLAENVGVIIHAAATIKLTDNLKTAVNINVCGVKRILSLATEAKKLEAFVYVSTAYSNCEKLEVEEKIYPVSVDPHQLIQSLEWMDEDSITAVTPLLLRGKPNTYTFSKALAESVVEEAGKNLPACIVRPSVVTGAFEGPIPGWNYGTHGVNAAIMAIGAGLYRNILSRPESVVDLVPVDVVVNCIIAAAWHRTIQSYGSMTVYNCCTSSLNPLKWGKFRELLLKNSRKNPLSKVVLYPKLSLGSYVWAYKARIFFLNWVPAYLVDGMLMLFGQRPTCVKTYAKIRKLSRIFENVTIRELKFVSDNLLHLHETMSPVDKAEFNLDLWRIEWDPYFENMWLGLKQFVAKDCDSKESDTASRMLWLKWMERVPIIAILGITVTIAILLLGGGSY